VRCPRDWSPKWPDTVHELKGVMESAVQLHPAGAVITAANLVASLRQGVFNFKPVVSYGHQAAPKQSNKGPLSAPMREAQASRLRAYAVGSRESFRIVFLTLRFSGDRSGPPSAQAAHRAGRAGWGRSESLLCS
jgi:hypothetical protein